MGEGAHASFPPQSVGFLQRSVLFFVEAISPAGFPVSLSHGYNTQGGRMTVSTLILILLLTFAGAGALERLRSTLIK
jgi:hypothetical protein